MMENVMTKVTNLQRATDMVKAGMDARTPKADMIAQIVSELNVSKANAFVYFTKATKALGVTITKGEGKAKPVKVVDDSVTVVKDGKRVKAKSKEVDEAQVAAFFENAKARMQEKTAKAAAASKASPFAALGI
jgi:ABC-type uncharacterized transport system ATPase subunit